MQQRSLCRIAVQPHADAAKGAAAYERLDGMLDSVKPLAGVALVLDELACGTKELAVKADGDAGARNDDGATRVTVECGRIVEQVVRVETHDARVVSRDAHRGSVGRLCSHANVARDKEDALLATW